MEKKNRWGNLKYHVILNRKDLEIYLKVKHYQTVFLKVRITPKNVPVGYMQNNYQEHHLLLQDVKTKKLGYIKFFHQ
jgi:hypothetical protein